MLKKILLVIILFTSMSVYASSGALSSDSIKTCPDGITYGSHKGGVLFIIIKQHTMVNNIILMEMQ